jgi:hypothetical protein
VIGIYAVNETAPVPPPLTDAPENEGFELAPFDTSGTPEVDPGAIEVIALPEPPTSALYCVIVTPEILPALVAFRIPVTPELMLLL